MAKAEIKLMLAVFLCLPVFVLYPQYGEAVVEDVECSPEPTDMTIEYGDLISCELDPIGDTDRFRFVGSVGETIIAQASRRDGGTPCIKLFDPDGAPIGSQVCGARIDATLVKTGTHTILVSEFLNNQTLGYGLVLERVAPPSPAATPLCFGCNISDVINGIGDLDLYTFNSSPGDVVAVLASWQSGGTPCIELFGPDGLPTPNGDQVCGARIDETLEQGGVHTILVSEFLNNQTVKYSVDLQCVSGECPPLDEPFTLTVIKAGTGSGTVTSSPAGISCGSDCTESFSSGTVVTLTATADSGSTFAGWSGDSDCTDGQVTMTANKTCTAIFNTQTSNCTDNQSPLAIAQAEPTSGSAPLTVQFDGDDSLDADGSIVAYLWTFGDGQTSTEPNPVHTYTSPGIYTATLIVTDDCGAISSDEVSIFICPVATALEEDPNKETKLDLLRQFRDEVLGASPEGEHYVELFYAHAAEVSWLLLRYPGLRSQSRILIDRFLPVVQSVLAGEQAVVREAELKDVEALLGTFVAYGSAELRAGIQAVQEELWKGGFLEQFGIVVR